MKHVTTAQARWFLFILLGLAAIIAPAWARFTNYHPLMVGYLVIAMLSLIPVGVVYILALKGRK